MIAGAGSVFAVRVRTGVRNPATAKEKRRGDEPAQTEDDIGIDGDCDRHRGGAMHGGRREGCEAGSDREQRVPHPSTHCEHLSSVVPLPRSERQTTAFCDGRFRSHWQGNHRASIGPGKIPPV